MKDSEYINMTMAFIQNSDQRYDALHENIHRMSNDRLEDTREIAQGFLKFNKEDLNLAKEGAKNFAKTSRELFRNLKSPIKLLDAIEKTNADDLFKFIQTANTAGIFKKYEQMTPSSRINTKEHKELKEFIKNITSLDSPDELKKFVVDYLKDPKNSALLKELTTDLTVALKTPGIKKLVAICTNPKLIDTAFSIINSNAGKNFVKVLADKNSSKSKIVKAYARLAATAIRKSTLHIPKLIKAGLILYKLDQNITKESNKDSPQRDYEMACQMFSQTASKQAKILHDQLIKTNTPHKITIVRANALDTTRNVKTTRASGGRS